MLGYISSTRKKSCRQCVKAKRRCDLGYPCCKRCFSKALDCAYPNASVRQHEVVWRQRTPDLAPLSGDSNLAWPAPGQSSLQPEPALLTTSESASSSSPESSTEYNSDYVYWRRSAEPVISQGLMPQVWAPGWLNNDQMVYMSSRIRSFIATLAYTGGNTFVHPNLYEKRQPAAFQDMCSLSALYLAKTKQNAQIISRSIDNKIKGLVASSRGWTLPEHLAAVQALVTYQIIRLFDGDTSVQARVAAAQHNRILDNWTSSLWKRALSEGVAVQKTWEAWVFHESLRRTVIISVFIRGAWSALTQGGLCDQVPILARLPMSKGDGFWDADEAEFNSKMGTEDGFNQLIAYGDFALTWQPGDDMSKLSEFQRLLLAPCRGLDDPRLYLE